MNTIRLFDRNFNYIFSTFEYQKLQASLKYYGKSNLAVEVNANSDIAHFLQEGIYLTFDHKGKQYPFVVKRRTVNNDTLTVQAVSPHDFFGRRITIPPEGSEAVTSTGSPDKVIKDFIRSCITGSRALPFSLSADRAGAAISEQSRFQNLASEVERICAAYGIGESFELDETDCCIKFDTYTGTDRTQDNTEDNPPCIFAAKYKNLSDYLYDWDGSTRQTTAIVGGQGEGIDREIVTVGDDAQGVDRYEVFVDARDVSKGNTELLTGRGLAAVMAVSETITTEESQTGNLVFGEDYFLGDLVTVQISVPDYQLENGYYDTVDLEILVNQRITEAVITIENGTYSVDLQYGDQQFTKTQTLIQEVDKLKVYAGTWSGDINDPTLVRPQIINGITGNNYYGNNDNDETALNAWLDALLNNMPDKSMQPVTISCYPAVSGYLYQGFIFKNSNDYASLSLRSYSSTTMEKVKFNGVWGNVRIIPTMIGASAYAVDYVTEQGTSGVWTYRKWESGKIEIHGHYSQGSINCDRAYGSVYISAMLYIALPSIDFTIKSVSISVDLLGGIGGVCIANNNDYSGSAISYFIWHATSRSNFSPVLDVYITGTWK